MRHHLLEGVVTAVVKVGRVEVRVHQGRSLEQSARSHVVLPMIDEGARGYVATGAAQGGIVGKRFPEQDLAATLGLARMRGELAGRAEARVRQEIDVLDIGDDRVDNRGRRLRARELADDDVAHEIAQRSGPAVVSIGCEIACAAQARDGHRVEQAVVRLPIEQRARGVEGAGTRRQSRHEQLGVGHAVDVASAAADAGLARDLAQDVGRAESEITQVDQVGLAPAGSLGMEALARLGERLLVQVGSGRQHRLVASDRKGAGIAGRQERPQAQQRAEQKPPSEHVPVPCAPARSARRLFECRTRKPDLLGAGLQRNHELLAQRAQLARIDTLEIVHIERRRELLDARADRCSELRVAGLELRGEDRPVGERDPVDIVAHVIERLSLIHI